MDLSIWETSRNFKVVLNRVLAPTVIYCSVRAMLCNHEEVSKKCSVSTDLNSVHVRYRWGALSTELWSYRHWEYVIHGRICFNKRFEWKWWIWNKSRMNGLCEFWLRSGQRSCVRIWRNRIVIYIGNAIGLASYRNLALFWETSEVDF